MRRWPRAAETLWDQGEGGAGLLLLLSAALVGCVGEAVPDAGDPGPMEELPPRLVLVVSEAGFSTPESVLHDPLSDAYLVANINGGPSEKDGNGFISRVSPGGEVPELFWVDGASPGVTLHAPKGMALVADTLFVTDIDCLRAFHRVTGEPLRELCLEEATFLNDLAASRNGDLYFSDSGSSGGPGAVYLLRGTADVPQKVALADGTLLEGEGLGGANGLAVDRRDLVVATFGSGEVFRVTPAGERIQLLPPSNLQLDGLIAVGDGTFIVSSWADSAVYRVGGEGPPRSLVSGLDAPADLGYDETRNRLLVPLFRAHELRVLQLR